MIDMTTTIQIDDETKKKLFQIKLELEKERGSSVSYNELLNYLINNQKINLIDKVNMKEFRRFEGIIEESALGEFLKERKKQLKNEEEKAQFQQI
jgi:flavorubredoxin